MEASLQRILENRHLSRKALVDLIVNEAVLLTRSTLGYLAVLSEDARILTMQAWSKSAMAACKTKMVPLTYPVEQTGLWGDCLRERGAVIVNDYAGCTRPTKKGYPDGHVPVLRHMNVPLRSGDRQTGVIGVGNKAEPYDEADAAALQAFADAVWPLIAAAKEG